MRQKVTFIRLLPLPALLLVAVSNAGDLLASTSLPVEAATPKSTEGQTQAVERWTLFRSYAFLPQRNDIRYSDVRKAGEIATFMQRYPSFRAGIDGENQERVDSVQEALIDAGVPPDMIDQGAYGPDELRRDSRVAVLLRD
ncbi:MAG: hypothetical protein JJT88_17950 [Gammaproteobacteria bacterium]|nr:hypothetical protein [Gammaproteobacteria bacterium]